jgi:hypothetical protein
VAGSKLFSSVVPMPRIAMPPDAPVLPQSSIWTFGRVGEAAQVGVEGGDPQSSAR